MFSRGAIFYLVAPLLELWVAIKVGAAYGAGLTVLGILALSALGASLLGSRGAGLFNSVVASAAKGQKISADDVADKSLELVGAALLVIPGFITGFVGLVLQVPLVRRLVKPLVASRLPRFSSTSGAFSHVFRRGDVIDVDGTLKSDTNKTKRSELG